MSLKESPTVSPTASASTSSIEAKIKALPTTPGVYLMKGGKGGALILYIGKAKNLRSRVRSYFRKTGDTRYAARFLADKTTDVDCIVTATEKEALILEDTLLKRHKPRYNIRLKDDKTYVSIKLTVQEKFPRIMITRRVVDDGSRYFGPYGSAKGVRETLKFLRTIFPLCVCTPHEFRNKTRPCLDYQLRLCAAPAVGRISEADYGELVSGAVLFLEGKNKELVGKLKANMRAASKLRRFEEAALLRDKIIAVEATLEAQKVVSRESIDRDAVGIYRDGVELAIVVLFIRAGRLVGKRDFIFKDKGLPGEEILSSFITQFYGKVGVTIPKEVLTPVRLDDGAFLSQYLSERRSLKVSVTAPMRGDKRKLVKMANDNAREAFNRSRSISEDPALTELKRRLRLTRLPRVIEAVDISNTGESFAVGAMVTFVDGLPAKDRYRRYRIKTVKGQNDFAMMREVLSRRFGGADKESPLPDLLLVDGGKGQLSMAVEVARELGLEGLAMVGLAKERVEPIENGKKKHERVFLVGVKDPVQLREGSKGEFLLMRVRDEVHRFAVTYHRKLRSKAVGSVLDSVPGIGPKKRRALFDRFKDLDGIRTAAIDELTAVSGITVSIARAIKDELA